MSNVVQQLLQGAVAPGMLPGMGGITKSIFGNRLGSDINQLPLDMIVGPVTGAMAATGPASKTNAQHLQEMIYGQGQVPGNMQQWLDWNTKFQPKPKSTTTTPEGGMLF